MRIIPAVAKRFLAFAILVAILVITPAVAVEAGDPTPSPLFSEFDPCLTRSPVNNVAAPNFGATFSGVLRDTHDEPIANYPKESMQLRITDSCPNPALIEASTDTDANGVVIWDATALTQGGGNCTTMSAVQVLIDGQLFASRPDIRSPDQDGNGEVGLSDIAIFQQGFVAGGPIYIVDLDCSGTNSIADLVFLQAHFVAGLE